MGDGVCGSCAVQSSRGRIADPGRAKPDRPVWLGSGPLHDGGPLRWVHGRASCSVGVLVVAPSVMTGCAGWMRGRSLARTARRKYGWVQGCSFRGAWPTIGVGRDATDFSTTRRPSESEVFPCLLFPSSAASSPPSSASSPAPSSASPPNWARSFAPSASPAEHNSSSGKRKHRSKPAGPRMPTDPGQRGSMTCVLRCA